MTDIFGATSRSPQCLLDELAQVGEVEHGAWNGLAPSGEEEDLVACFSGGEDDAWLLASTQGRGTVIALGSAVPFVNANLDRADNAVLAAALLAPEPGDRVVIVPPAAVGEGETAVTDLVPDGFWRLLWLGVAAAVVAVVWRSRRLGPPVDERLPPVLPSAELAGSIAALLQRAGDRGTAAMRLRADVRDDALHRLGIPPATADDQLVALVAARTGAPSDVVRLALLDGAVADDAGLLELARACHAVRANLRHPEPVAPDGTR